MDFRHFFLLMCTSLLDINCHDTDFAILEKIAAAGENDVCRIAASGVHCFSNSLNMQVQ